MRDRGGKGADPGCVDEHLTTVDNDKGVSTTDNWVSVLPGTTAVGPEYTSELSHLVGSAQFNKQGNWGIYPLTSHCHRLRSAPGDLSSLMSSGCSVH